MSSPLLRKRANFVKNFLRRVSLDFCLQTRRRYGNVACGMTRIIRIAIIGITGISPGG